MLDEGVRSDSPFLKEKVEKILNSGLHPEPNFLEKLYNMIAGKMDPEQLARDKQHSQKNLTLSWMKNEEDD